MHRHPMDPPQDTKRDIVHSFGVRKLKLRLLRRQDSVMSQRHQHYPMDVAFTLSPIIAATWCSAPTLYPVTSQGRHH